MCHQSPPYLPRLPTVPAPNLYIWSAKTRPGWNRPFVERHRHGLCPVHVAPNVFFVSYCRSSLEHFGCLFFCSSTAPMAYPLASVWRVYGLSTCIRYKLNARPSVALRSLIACTSEASHTSTFCEPFFPSSLLSCRLAVRGEASLASFSTYELY